MRAENMTHEIAWTADQLTSGLSGGDIAPKLAGWIAASYALDLESACKLACEITAIADKQYRNRELTQAEKEREWGRRRTHADRITHDSGTRYQTVMAKLSKREASLIAEHKRINPRSRCETIIRYVRNGATKKQRGCVLCDEAGPSWCARYPKTKQADDWEREHRAKHGV